MATEIERKVRVRIYGGGGCARATLTVKTGTGARRNAEYEYEIPVADGVVMAEVELPREDIDLPLPPWIGREVTGNPDYKKINLQKARLAARAAGS